MLGRGWGAVGHGQRGIFGFGLSGQETEERQQQEVTQERTQERTSTAERETESGQTQQQEAVTTALPEEVQSLLTNLIMDLGGRGLQAVSGGQNGVRATQTSGDLAQLSRDLAERARQGEEEINAAITAIVADQDRRGREGIQRLVTDAARQVGGSLGNTLVTRAGGAAEAELSSQLAATEGQLRLAGRQLTTGEFAEAVGGLQAAPAAAGAEANQLVQLVSALRGATTTQVGTSTLDQRSRDVLASTENLTELLDRMMNQQADRETDQSGFNFSF